MISLKVASAINVAKLLASEKRGVAIGLKHAGAMVRKTARDLVSVSGGAKKKPSVPGTPPHRQSGKLRNSIAFDQSDPNRVQVGVLRRSYGWYGHLHEHGGNGAAWGYRAKVLGIGDEGPIRIGHNYTRDKRGRFRKGKEAGQTARLTTQAMVDRANKINKILVYSLKRGRRKGSAEGAVIEDFKTEFKFPARPFMRPALIKNLDRIPYSFKDRILTN